MTALYLILLLVAQYSRPLVQLAVNVVLCLVGRGAGGEHEEVGDVLGWHVLQQLIGHGQGLARACGANTQHLGNTMQYLILISASDVLMNNFTNKPI